MRVLSNYKKGFLELSSYFAHALDIIQKKYNGFLKKKLCKENETYKFELDIEKTGCNFLEDKLGLRGAKKSAA